MYNTNKPFSTFSLGYTTEKRVYLWPFYSIVANSWKSFWKRPTLLLFRGIRSSERLVPTTEDTIRKAKAGRERYCFIASFRPTFPFLSHFFHNATSICDSSYGFAIFIEGNFFPWRYQRNADLFIFSATV